MSKQSDRLREPILLLVDGTCNLCHGIVRFVVKRDPTAQFRFASIQSTVGQQLLTRVGLPRDELDTFVMIDGPRFYTKSDAALRVLRELTGFWPLLYGCLAVPRFIRNRIYDFIANHRYRWFGQRTNCLLPTAELRNRIIEHIEEVSVHEE